MLSVETLTWFIEAFQMSDVHTATLWRLYDNDLLDPTHLSESLDAPMRRPIPASAYRVQALDEFHQVGPDSLPAYHQTFHVIQALEPLYRYSYQFDTSTASVEVLRGGKRGATYPSDTYPGITAVDIVFPHALEPGDTIALEYRTNFHYSERPAPELRRVIRHVVPSANIEVRFDRARLPQHLWWATWETLDSLPVIQEELPFEARASAHRFFESLEPSIVGFMWEWE